LLKYLTFDHLICSLKLLNDLFIVLSRFSA